MNIKITGVGSYIPEIVKKNEAFLNHSFLNSDGTPISTPNTIIIDKFESITGIAERRYTTPDLNASDLGFFAAEKAILDAKIDPETIDYIIVAHNFGDVKHNSIQSDLMPSLAVRVKNRLGIKNPKCVAYDILFGCPGWIEAVIQANAFIKANIAKRCLVIGCETLSRVVDKHDRDAMIFADGAGATIIELTQDKGGILTHETATYSNEEAKFLVNGTSNNKDTICNTHFIKMEGRKIYEFALIHVPNAMKECLDKSGFKITDVKKIFIHQANEKMDEAILSRFYRLYRTEIPEHIMPMSIKHLGNSSVATIPTLLDLVKRNTYKEHKLNAGDIILFASVGAGMHINAIVYQY